MQAEHINRCQFSIARMLAAIALIGISVPFWLLDTPWVVSGHITGGFCLGGAVVGAAVGGLLVPIFLSRAERLCS